MFDVVEIQIKAPHTVRVMDRNMDEANAEAYIKFAVMRRGVEHSFFLKVPTGKYRDGDLLEDSPMPQASAELRGKMAGYFGGAGIDDWPPTAFLLDQGWHERGGVWRAPAREITIKEWDCMDFLIDEWDHDFDASKTAVTN